MRARTMALVLSAPAAFVMFFGMPEVAFASTSQTHGQHSTVQLQHVPCTPAMPAGCAVAGGSGLVGGLDSSECMRLGTTAACGERPVWQGDIPWAGDSRSRR